MKRMDEVRVIVCIL